MTWLFFGILFVLGLAAGSFISVWVPRLHSGEAWIGGRSRCGHCRHHLSWFDLMPMISFLNLRGRCRYCKKSFSWQYPAMEFFAGALFVFLGYISSVARTQTISLELGVLLVGSVCLLAVFVSDFLYQEIPLEMTVWPGLMIFVIQWIFDLASPVSLVLGVLVTSGWFLLQYIISKGKWIGFGDVYLGVLIGVLLGWPSVLLALMLAYVGGALWSLVLIILKKQKLKGRTAFGTYLAMATFVTIIWGEKIVSWYLGLVVPL